MGITIIALGVNMTSAMQAIPRPLGLLFIGIGGVFHFGNKREKEGRKAISIGVKYSPTR